ncbi:hypothetical protein [Brevibacillus parabrevis]|uniref:hypothetical protein n=2 Tax=Brevibacillus parabrevis TaxID=54914 RepID=UPI001C23BAF8|nr:hypothetical protein [Brevibacillus parabrevis]MBU8715518.1 hypothetical protein [Brevibacillus parabrevis]
MNLFWKFSIKEAGLVNTPFRSRFSVHPSTASGISGGFFRYAGLGSFHEDRKSESAMAEMAGEGSGAESGQSAIGQGEKAGTGQKQTDQRQTDKRKNQGAAPLALEALCTHKIRKPKRINNNPEEQSDNALRAIPVFQVKHTHRQKREEQPGNRPKHSRLVAKLCFSVQSDAH